jgi:hypothetical protein
MSNFPSLTSTSNDAAPPSPTKKGQEKPNRGGEDFETWSDGLLARNSADCKRDALHSGAASNHKPPPPLVQFELEKLRRAVSYGSALFLGANSTGRLGDQFAR